ncbi:hypothetical protein M422DRAFT_180235 [Sphaerobolus stellatus SS14]|uniref:tryptophan synthase n=1 Tax=Sphaerobolus stellatus (strain SS14) TaxID=990650 RepID=A0A0C9VE94_SPHS4|nr:hypothetical protein M422DRAFT_180235 [Sphaerobolus stellatus SS14]
MAEVLRNVFESKKAQGTPAFVTFVTAGYPTKDATVPIMLAMQAGGTDIIELGMPFSDPMADGPAIQESNSVALKNNIEYTTCLNYVKEARQQGLTIPVLLMGYYNPILSYGEEKAVQDAKMAGAHGFIIVDLPPEEAIRFREVCTSNGLSYIPLIAPSTSLPRIKLLAGIADSFIYIVSKMGTTGSSDQQGLNQELPQLVKRVREHSSAYLAVGFGVSNREHFQYVADSGADGVVIGSKIVNVLKSSPPDQYVERVKEYCASLTGHDGSIKIADSVAKIAESIAKFVSQLPSALPQLSILPSRFGQFGGQYVPEALVDCLVELEQAHTQAIADPEFWKEFEGLYGYINRPSNLYLAERLTEDAGGARIWLKREDLYVS